MKRIRRGARIVLIDPEMRVLLLRFVYREGPLAGTEYWGVPGGGLEEDESPEEGATRELWEETGLETGDLGGVRGELRYDFRLISGEDVVQHDWYFALRVGAGVVLSRDGFTPEEKETMVEARWWGVEELGMARERVVPGELATFLGGWPEFENS